MHYHGGMSCSPILDRNHTKRGCTTMEVCLAPQYLIEITPQRYVLLPNTWQKSHQEWMLYHGGMSCSPIHDRNHTKSRCSTTEVCLAPQYLIEITPQRYVLLPNTWQKSHQEWMLYHIGMSCSPILDRNHTKSGCSTMEVCLAPQYLIEITARMDAVPWRYVLLPNTW